MDPAVRERLLEVVLTQLAGKGRGAMSLTEVLEAADVTQADFAADYRDLDSCLADAYERLTIRLDTAVRAGCASGGDEGFGTRETEWPTQVRTGLEALLVELAVNPELALALTRSYPSLGPTQQERYQAFLDRLASELRMRRELGGIIRELPADVDLLAVGAAEAIVFEEISSGRAESLPRMTISILFSVLVPFLGPEGAAAEIRKAQHTS